MDNTGLMRVIMGQAVPFIGQLFAAPVGGSSDSRTAYTPFDDLNGTMKNCYRFILLSAGKIRGLGAAAPIASAGRNSPRQGARHRTRCISAHFSEVTYPSSPAFSIFSASSLAPGRREISIRNSLIVSPSVVIMAGNTPSKIAPCLQRRLVRALRYSLRIRFRSIFCWFSSW